MKKLLAMLLALTTLVSCFAITGVTASAVDEVTWSGAVGDVYVPSADVAGTTPTIDGIISDDEPYTDPVRIDAVNGATAWSYRSRNLVTIDYYNSWDGDGLYVAATVTDPTPYYSTVSPDTSDDGEGSEKYGGDGDVLVFCIDPLGLKASTGKVSGESQCATAWYSFAPMTDGSYTIYRSIYNAGDITDEVEAAVVYNSSNTFTVEMKFTWEMILSDTATACGKTVEALGVDVEDLAADGTDHNVMLRYMDRWAYYSKDSYSGYHVGYLDEGARFTISCNVTYNDMNGNAVDAGLYGIYLHLSEGKVYTYGDYTYISLKNDTEAKIISYNGNNVDPLIIPSVLDGRTVVTVDSYAFSGLASISIYVPSTVTTMNAKCFYSCLGIKLYVVKNSAAYTYAKKNYISYVLSCDEHTLADWVIVTEASCTSYGYKTRSCYECGLLLDSVTIAKLAHTVGAYTITSVATCTTQGVKTAKCTVCGGTASTITYSDPDNHSYGDWIYDGVAFCRGGYKNHTCTRCGNIEYSNDDVEGCVAGEWATILEPTETTNGVQVKQCVYCGKVMEVELLDRNVDQTINTLTMTVDQLDEGAKDVFISKGKWVNYRQVADNRVVMATSLKFSLTDYIYNYTVSEPGVYTVYIRYNDGRAPFYYYITVDLPTPEVTIKTEGLTAYVGGLDDVKAIRIGKGEVSASVIKTAECYVGYSASVVNGKDPFEIKFSSAGIWTVVVEFNSGIKVTNYVTLTE